MNENLISKDQDINLLIKNMKQKFSIGEEVYVYDFDYLLSNLSYHIYCDMIFGVQLYEDKIFYFLKEDDQKKIPEDQIFYSLDELKKKLIQRINLETKEKINFFNNQKEKRIERIKNFDINIPLPI